LAGHGRWTGQFDPLNGRNTEGQKAQVYFFDLTRLPGAPVRVRGYTPLVERNREGRMDILQLRRSLVEVADGVERKLAPKGRYRGGAAGFLAECSPLSEHGQPCHTLMDPNRRHESRIREQALVIGQTFQREFIGQDGGVRVQLRETGILQGVVRDPS